MTVVNGDRVKHPLPLSYHLPRFIFAGQYIYLSVAAKAKSFLPAQAANAEIDRDLGVLARCMPERALECCW